MNLTANPAFTVYAITILVLSLNMLVLWALSGGVRAKTHTTPNKEDSKDPSKTRVVDADPPEVARVLRAHKNAMANIVPFAILGLVYVLAGGSAMTAAVIFGVFTFARVAHSFAYLGGKQPWRTIFFSLGGAATLALMGFIVKAIAVGA